MELTILKEPKLVVALDIGSRYSGYSWQWRKEFLNNRSNVEFNTNWGAGAVQSILKEPKLVVALDIGSTYSGYAWQWRKDFLNNRSNVEFNTNWGAGSLQLHKTTTCLLLNKHHEIDSFGHVAKRRWFCDYYGQEDGDNWFFFKEFKLLLDRPDKFKEDMKVEDFNDNPHPLLDVMSKFVKALKDHFIKNHLKDKGHTVNMKETLWVVTVPAIWSDQAKKFMRKAAEQGDIPRNNLLLANEPESAALYCLHLPSEQRRGMNNFGGTGDKFLTVDIGGGTLDMCAIEVLPDGNLKEMCADPGKRVGGQDVNNAFVQSCKDVIEGDAWHILGSRNAEELLKMETDFENKKVQIGSSDERDERIYIPMPPHITIMLDNGKLSIKPEGRDSKYFKIKDGKLLFTSALIREVLFQETVEMILTHVKTMLERVDMKDLTTVVLVGGFAQSPIVVEKIRALLTGKFSHIKAVFPTSPFRAVLHGAVLFGHDPLIFLSRISRATFGVGTNRLFDPSKHEEEKKWRNNENGKDYCKDIMSVHVRKDQSVYLKETQPSWTYNPMYKTQTEVLFGIYASSEQEPTYTTDDGCNKIGEFTVALPDTEDGTDRNIKVKMIYGGTELSVAAIDELHKTTTCLLLDKNHEIDSFGQVAERRWFHTYYDQDASELHKWFFFKEFKLILYKTNQAFNEQLSVGDFLARPMPLVEVMSKLIKALKDHFIKNMEVKGQRVNMKQTLWVVTVPAFWSMEAKQFMRDAAETSGIPKTHLLLAHEPESAALYCLHLPSEQRKQMNNFGGTGDKFLTVDLGGGTLDMAAIEVLSDGNGVKICAGNGMRVGGQDVNSAFIQSCKDVIGDDAWRVLATKHEEELMIMETDFDHTKVQIGSSDERDEKIYIALPLSITRMVSEGKMSIKSNKYFKVDTGKVVFTSDLIREKLYREICELILVHVKQMLELNELKDITTVFLVGGLAQSPIVVEEIRTMLTESFPHVTAVVPTSPFRAVLAGAVLYGHDPLIFQNIFGYGTQGSDEIIDIDNDPKGSDIANDPKGSDLVPKSKCQLM